MNKEYIIALGSNLGDRYANIEKAICLINERVGGLLASSSLYETQAVYHAENKEEKQGDYINSVIVVSSVLSAQEVMKTLLQIELELGRRRSKNDKKWSARKIDLDLLAHGDEVIDTEHLQLPHPRMHERSFVLIPLAEVAPTWVHPLLGKTARELLS